MGTNDPTRLWLQTHVLEQHSDQYKQHVVPEVSVGEQTWGQSLMGHPASWRLQTLETSDFGCYRTFSWFKCTRNGKKLSFTKTVRLLQTYLTKLLVWNDVAMPRYGFKDKGINRPCFMPYRHRMTSTLDHILVSVELFWNCSSHCKRGVGCLWTPTCVCIINCSDSTHCNLVLDGWALIPIQFTMV